MTSDWNSQSLLWVHHARSEPGRGRRQSVLSFCGEKLALLAVGLGNAGSRPAGVLRSVQGWQ